MLKRFFGYYKPYKHLFMLDFCCAILAAMLELSFPVVVNSVIDSILPSGNWNLILLVSVGPIGVVHRQHSNAVCRRLFWARTRGQHRNRYAPGTLRPYAEAAFQLL